MIDQICDGGSRFRINFTPSCYLRLPCLSACMAQHLGNSQGAEKQAVQRKVIS